MKGFTKIAHPSDAFPWHRIDAGEKPTGNIEYLYLDFGSAAPAWINSWSHAPGITTTSSMAFPRTSLSLSELKGGCPQHSGLEHQKKRAALQPPLSRYLPCKTNASILAVHNPGYASKHRRAGCPIRLAAANRSRQCNRSTDCMDFRLPWSHNRGSGRSGLGWRSVAWPQRARLPTQEPQQRRGF